MNTKSLFFSLFASALLVGACASKASRLSVNPNNQEEYAQYADARLSQWNDAARKLPSVSQKALQASVEDARIELHGLRAATDSSWVTYRNRIDTALNRMERTYGQGVVRK